MSHVHDPHTHEPVVHHTHDHVATHEHASASNAGLWTVLGILLALVLAAVFVWFVLGTSLSAPETTAPPGQPSNSGPTININPPAPQVNVNPPAQQPAGGAEAGQTEPGASTPKP